MARGTYQDFNKVDVKVESVIAELVDNSISRKNVSRIDVVLKQDSDRIRIGRHLPHHVSPVFEDFSAGFSMSVFNDGKVQQLSRPDELYEAPENSFVAGFIGENNIFNGTVSEIDSDNCKVKLENGAEVLANPISVKAKGDKTTISLRPERALINPKDKMDNNHQGKIKEVIYHGDHTRVRIDVLGNDQFILKIPNSISNLDIKLGKEINVGLNSKDSRALDPK